jgi:hypothetical protein
MPITLEMPEQCACKTPWPNFVVTLINGKHRVFATCNNGCVFATSDAEPRQKSADLDAAEGQGRR